MKGRGRGEGEGEGRGEVEGRVRREVRGESVGCSPRTVSYVAHSTITSQQQ